MSTEELQEIKKFNRNIEWLKKQTLKPVAMVTARQVTQALKIDREQLRRMRVSGQIEFVKAKTGGYRYKLIQKQTA